MLIAYFQKQKPKKTNLAVVNCREFYIVIIIRQIYKLRWHNFEHNLIAIPINYDTKFLAMHVENNFFGAEIN